MGKKGLRDGLEDACVNQRCASDIVLWVGGKQLERVSGIASRSGLIIAVASFSAIFVTLFLYFWPIYEVMPHSEGRDYFIGQFIKISLILLATVLLPATLCILTFPLYVWAKKSGYAGSRLYEVAAPFCWLATFLMTYLLRQV